MGQKPRVTLPAVERALAEARGIAAGNPTVDAARERLGDRVGTEPDVGQAVRVTSGLGVEHLGVVIFRQGAAVDVWLGAGRVRRLSGREGDDAVSDASASELPPALAAIAAGAVIFGSLYEGQRVRYEAPDGRAHEALLVEKCRYGALVLTDEDAGRKIMAVGFQGLSPA